jgi:cyclic pyranopterin phosphate synthase
MSLVSPEKTKVKINAVLMRGFNDGDMIERLADYSFKKGILLRFIEFMPLHSNLWSEQLFMPFSEAFARLTSRVDRWVEDQAGEKTSAGPASYHVNARTGQRIGVISAVSRHFCGTCNRLRVTSTGNVRPCLFGGRQVSIAEALRARDDQKTRSLLGEAVAIKPAAGAIRPESGRREDFRMNKIGG